MSERVQALIALGAALSRSEPKHREIEEAWLAALVEAAGTRYERRLRAAVELDLEERTRAREMVQSILDRFAEG